MVEAPFRLEAQMATVAAGAGVVGSETAGEKNETIHELVCEPKGGTC
jgi:hypothetical protein